MGELPHSSLESRLKGLGIAAGLGILVGAVSRVSDDQFDARATLTVMLSLMGGTYAFGVSYIAEEVGGAREKLEAVKELSIFEGAVLVAYLGTYFA